MESRIIAQLISGLAVRTCGAVLAIAVAIYVGDYLSNVLSVVTDGLKVLG